MLIAAAAIIAGFIVLMWSADLFVAGAAAIARNLGMPPLVIGLTIVSMGTSAPEVLVSLAASFADVGTLAIGNAIGSNIANIGLVLGVTLLIVPLLVAQRAIRTELLILLAVTAVAGLMLADGLLSATEGWLLVGSMIVIMSGLLRSQARNPSLLADAGEESLPQMTPLRSWFTFALGLALLIASSRLLVWGAVIAAHRLGISELMIGLTVVAIGTSLPELAATVTSALRGHKEIAIGNVVGSNLFNLLAVMAIPGIVSSQAISPQALSRDYLYMTVLTVILALSIYLGSMRRKAPAGHAYLGRSFGMLLVTFYALYYYLLYISIRGS